MAAKIRVKCPHCGEVENVHSEVGICSKCRQPYDFSGGGSIYLYRQGSPLGVAGGFGIYINSQPCGHIGNKELLRIPVQYGTYNLHVAAGMSRRCQDMQITISPQCPVAYTKVHMRPGFWTNSFVIEPVDPNLLDL